MFFYWFFLVPWCSLFKQAHLLHRHQICHSTISLRRGSKFSAFHPPPGLQSFVPILMATFVRHEPRQPRPQGKKGAFSKHLLFGTPVLSSLLLSLFLSISLLTLLAVFIRTGLVVDDSSIKTMASVPELLSFWRFSIFFFCTYVFNIIESADSNKCNLNEQAQDANGSIFCSMY